MSYGWYWCKECKTYRKLHEVGGASLWCDNPKDHDWEIDIDWNRVCFDTDDRYEEFEEIISHWDTPSQQKLKELYSKGEIALLPTPAPDFQQCHECGMWSCSKKKIRRTYA
jgi:hypothetical protein